MSIRTGASSGKSSVVRDNDHHLSKDFVSIRTGTSSSKLSVVRDNDIYLSKDFVCPLGLVSHQVSCLG